MAATSPTTSRASLWTGEPLEDAIDAAIARWMGWRIDRRTSRDEGIPHGLPYLTGWVTHFQILDEAAGLIPPPFRLPPRCLRDRAARGRSRAGMVPAPRNEGTTR